MKKIPAHRAYKNMLKVKNDSVPLDACTWGHWHTHTCPVCQHDHSCTIAHGKTLSQCSAEESMHPTCYEADYALRLAAYHQKRTS